MLYWIICELEFNGAMASCNKGVFIWRRASPLGRTSPSKRDGFHPTFTWEKPALLPGLACLAESPGLTNPESDICVQVSILQRTHKQTELVKWKVIQKMLAKTNFVVYTELWLASLPRRASTLSAFIWKISSPPMRDLGKSIARSRQGGLALLSYKRKTLLHINTPK